VRNYTLDAPAAGVPALDTARPSRNPRATRFFKPMMIGMVSTARRGQPRLNALQVADFYEDEARHAIIKLVVILASCCSSSCDHDRDQGHRLLDGLPAQVTGARGAGVSEKTHYQVWPIRKRGDEIKKAVRELARKYHRTSIANIPSTDVL